MGAFFRRLGIGLILFLFAAAVMGAQPGLEVQEDIFTEAPFPSSHASTIIETEDGLLAAWFGGTKEKAPDVEIWTARRKAGKWSTPVSVANGVQSPGLRHPTWNPVLFQPKDGPLMLFYKVGPSPQEWWGMVIRSSDDGRSWSAPERLPGDILGPIKNKPVQLADGTILSPSSVETPTRPTLWQVRLERSEDGGRTWTGSGPLNDGVKIQAIQPSVLVYSGGDLQMIGRTRQGRVFELWSKDEGRTWGELTLTDLPNPDAGTDAVTLRDGRHLLVYNATKKGRTPLNVAISDDGKSWKPVLVLEDQPGQFAYPAIIQGQDGKVHITYTWNRKHIRYARIDPAKL